MPLMDQTSRLPIRFKSDVSAAVAVAVVDAKLPHYLDNQWDTEI